MYSPPSVRTIPSEEGDAQPSLRTAALAAYEAGIAVRPPRQDGSKRPLGNWKEGQVQRPSLEQVERWYADGRTGLGGIMGAVSGGVQGTDDEVPGGKEALEFDDRPARVRFN